MTSIFGNLMSYILVLVYILLSVKRVVASMTAATRVVFIVNTGIVRAKSSSLRCSKRIARGHVSVMSHNLTQIFECKAYRSLHFSFVCEMRSS